uniref:Uncharacterized protein n=1 Tax=Anguilla anguilla TaxID=7936 RepID=A0A0E9RAJ0_ANGAN
MWINSTISKVYANSDMSNCFNGSAVLLWARQCCWGIRDCEVVQRSAGDCGSALGYLLLNPIKIQEISPLPSTKAEADPVMTGGTKKRK